MCGIIGYIGNKSAEPVLLAGLKRMEYRGYDSAGIAVLNKHKLIVVKAKGRVADLEQKLKGQQNLSHIGIGHTRWATHGRPSEPNAHPHIGGCIAIIHNGIIENHEVLRVKLKKSGVRFVSETDSEVLAWLINQYYDGSLQAAVKKALARVEGAFGLIAMAADQPDQLVVARRSSPIILGRRQGAMFIASDAAALAGYADEIVHLEDNEMAVCQADSYEIVSLQGVPQTRAMKPHNLSVANIQKQGHKHFLIKEILEQPDAITAVLRGRLDMANGTSHLGGLNLSDRKISQLQHIFIIGCGTAYYGGLFARYYLEKLTGLPVTVEMASEFRYRDGAIPPKSVGLIVSQSGETADTRAALQELKRRGIPTIGIVNVVGSTIAREVEGGIYLHAGPEISVASTKAFTNQVVAMLLFGLHVGRQRGMNVQTGQEVVAALQQLPAEIAAALKLRPRIKRLAPKLARFEHAFYLGRDSLFPIALEGSLKVKEISYLHAEAYASGEMKHGAIALVDKALLVIYLLGKGPLYDKSLSNLAEVQARQGTVLVVTDNQLYSRTHPDCLFVKTSSPWTAPLLFNAVLQLLAYEVADARKLNIDQPRNLAKSVTVE